MDAAIIVFVKHPEPGKVKTRLAADIGDEKAVQVYRILLQHTYLITRQAGKTLYVFYSEEPVESDIWEGPHIIKRKQRGTDLGERMYQAFEEVFSDGYNQVVIVGSDCYELTTDIIRDAFAALEQKDAVIGPALDGGYYLLGQKKNNSPLFRNKIWSTDTVFTDTLQDFAEEQLTYDALPVLSDVDVVADINFPY